MSAGTNQSKPKVEATSNAGTAHLPPPPPFDQTAAQLGGGAPEVLLRLASIADSYSSIAASAARSADSSAAIAASAARSADRFTDIAASASVASVAALMVAFAYNFFGVHKR